MKILFLLRHAKSSWDDARLSDFERPLNERGLRVAPQMGKFMSERGFAPDLILSSPAARARETARLVKESANFQSEIRFEPKIYEATVGDTIPVWKV
jgi:phosphohistidine phosphatase